MSGIASALMVFAAQMNSSPPPMSIPLQHPTSAQWREVETTYRCAGGDRRLTIRYDGLVKTVSLVRGRRLGKNISRASLAAGTHALRRLDAVGEILPECGNGFDVLMVLGRLGKQRVLVFLIWKEKRLDASEPNEIDPLG